MGSRIAKILVIVASTVILISTAFPATPEQLEQQALEAMTAGRYTDASRLLEEMLQQQPNNPRALYNLACCLSRTDDLPAAAKQLEAAWEAGLRDTELLRTDPDLANLRASAKGGALITRMIAEQDKIQKLRGSPHLFEAPMLGSMRVVAPRHMEEGRKYPLVVILHGHGANPESYVSLFDIAETGSEAIICAPYGPYPIARQSGHGYSWYPPPWLFRDVLAAGGSEEDRAARRSELEQTEQAVTDRHVFAAIEAVSKAYPVDEQQIFLMGHSEGGILAYSLGLNNPHRFSGLIIVGARLRDSDASPELLAAAAGRLRVLICHSKEDQAIAFDYAKTAQNTLAGAGVKSRLLPYKGGHGLTAPLIRTIDGWIREEPTQ